MKKKVILGLLLSALFLVCILHVALAAYESVPAVGEGACVTYAQARAQGITGTDAQLHSMGFCSGGGVSTTQTTDSNQQASSDNSGASANTQKNGVEYSNTEQGTTGAEPSQPGLPSQISNLDDYFKGIRVTLDQLNAEYDKAHEEYKACKKSAYAKRDACNIDRDRFSFCFDEWEAMDDKCEKTISEKSDANTKARDNLRNPISSNLDEYYKGWASDQLNTELEKVSAEYYTCQAQEMPEYNACGNLVLGDSIHCMLMVGNNDKCMVSREKRAAIYRAMEKLPQQNGVQQGTEQTDNNNQNTETTDDSAAEAALMEAVVKASTLKHNEELNSIQSYYSTPRFQSVYDKLEEEAKAGFEQTRPQGIEVVNAKNDYQDALNRGASQEEVAQLKTTYDAKMQLLKDSLQSQVLDKDSSNVDALWQLGTLSKWEGNNKQSYEYYRDAIVAANTRNIFQYQKLLDSIDNPGTRMLILQSMEPDENVINIPTIDTSPFLKGLQDNLKTLAQPVTETKRAFVEEVEKISRAFSISDKLNELGLSPVGGKMNKPKKTKPATTKWAIASLIFGILSLIIGWLPVFGWICIILAILFGIFALKKVCKEGLSGKGMAITGLILGGIGIVFAILMMVYITSIGKNITCPDMNCFLANANQCKPATYEEVIAIGKISYSIKSDNSGNCTLIKEMVELSKNEDAFIKKALEGKKMECEYSSGKFNRQWTTSMIEGLEYCHGEFKDAIGQLLILI